MVDSHQTDKIVLEKENSIWHSPKILDKFHVSSRCRIAMLKKAVVNTKTKSDWLLKFQFKKPTLKVENFQLFFPPSFSALFSDIAQSCLNCACTQKNLGRIFSLLGFFSWNGKGSLECCLQFCEISVWNIVKACFSFSGFLKLKRS